MIDSTRLYSRSLLLRFTLESLIVRAAVKTKEGGNGGVGEEANFIDREDEEVRRKEIVTEAARARGAARSGPSNCEELVETRERGTRNGERERSETKRVDCLQCSKLTEERRRVVLMVKGLVEGR